VTTQHQIGIYIRDHCKDLKISDYTGKKKDSSQYRQMTRTYNHFVRVFMPPRELSDKGRMALVSYSRWPEKLKLKVFSAVLELFPDLSRFANNWVGHKLAALFVNRKTDNEKTAELVAPTTSRAVLQSSSNCKL
jgi:hypothetical protein